MKNKVTRFNITYFKVGFLAFFMGISTLALFSQGTWSASPALPATSRQLAISFVLNGKGYCGTGWNAGYINDFFVFDPITAIWTPLGNHPAVGRQGAVAFTDGTRAFMFGGSTANNYTNGLWEYLVATDTWVVKTSCPMGFFGGTSFVLGDKAYVVGRGFYGPSESLCWRYDITNDTWQQMNNFTGTPRHFATSLVFNGIAYYGLGSSGLSGPEYNDFWQYNELSDTWTQLANFPSVPRGGATDFVLCNKIFVGMGRSSSPVIDYNDMYNYNVGTNTWTPAINLPTSPGRNHSQAFVINNAAYVGTGRTGNTYLNDFWKFTACNSAPPPCSNNMVVNGDFETNTTCPTGSGQLPNATGWSDATDTPDYLNNGAGCWSGAPFFPASTPFQGNGFGGFFSQINGVSSGQAFSNNSERMFGTLTSNMIAGQTYNISFALKNDSLMSEHDASFSDSLGVGIYLWNSISGIPPVLMPRTSTATIPQVSVIASSIGNTYTVYTFTHTATDNYDSFVLGGFYIGTAYYTPFTGLWFGKYFNVDNVCITPVVSPPPTSQCDTLCGPNLAPNPGFEGTTLQCADTSSEMFTNYSQVQNWFGIACDTCAGNGSTPDYNNSLCNGPSSTNNCDGSNGSIGFFTYAIAGANAREYVQAQLTSPLIAGMEYCVAIDVKTSTGSFAYKPSDGLGLWFTNQMVDIDTQNGGQQFLGAGSLINATPQIANAANNFIDTVCQTITGTFIATGTEQWIVIGNFRDDANTNFNTPCSFFNPCFGYLIIDNLSVRTSCNNVPLPPTITLSAINDTVCNGSCTGITAAITGGTAPFTVTWDNGLPNGTGPHNVCPTTTTTYTAIVTDSTGLADTASITLYVNPVSTSSSNSTICSGDSLFVGGAWQTTNGVYNDTLSTTLGCDSILSTTLTVNPSDTATITYLSGSYCLSDPDPTPTNTGTLGGTFIINNSGTINASTGQINIPTSGVGSYVITYTTSGFCPDTTTFNVTIVSSTDATITQVGPFCANGPSLNLSAISPGGTWTGTGIISATNGTFSPATAGSGNHIVTYTISGACGDVDTMIIVVNPSDTATFTYSSGSYCLSDPDPTPTNTGTLGGTFIINNSGVINSTTGQISIPTSGIGNYVITYTTLGSCPDTATFNITITSCTIPTGGYTVSDSIICATSCIVFTDASSGATAWQWTFNGGTPSSSSSQNPGSVCFDTAGTYTIEQIVTNSNGSDTVTTTVIVNLLPTVNAGNDVTINLGTSTTLSATGTNGTYTWTPPTWLDCPTCVSPTSTPDETITYTITVLDSNGCSATDNVTVVVDFDNVVFVPNIFSPNGDGSNDILFVRGKGIAQFQFFVYDRWGEKVFETKDLNTGWNGVFRGKKMNNAVFVYYLKGTFIDGSEFEQKGDITLIR